MCKSLLCDYCGYDLTGLKGRQSCPECGRSIRESEKTARRKKAWLRSNRRALRYYWVGAQLCILSVLLTHVLMPRTSYLSPMKVVVYWLFVIELVGCVSLFFFGLLLQATSSFKGIAGVRVSLIAIALLCAYLLFMVHALS